MEVSELRIGNYVTVDNQDSWRNLKNVPLCVTGINNHMDSQDLEFFPDSDGKVNLKSEYETYGQFSQFVVPIELTEEWLLKFGFEKVNYTFWAKGLAVHNHNIVSFYMLYDQNRTYIKYVHQLQNLYHSLCGEELKIKEI